MSGLKETLERRAARLGMSIDKLLVYDRKKLREPIVSKETAVLITEKEHNICALLDLMLYNNIRVRSVTAYDPREGAETRITSEFIPSMTTELRCEAPFTDVFDIIQGSEEFHAIATVVPLP